jgi:hypothetical protein
VPAPGARSGLLVASTLLLGLSAPSADSWPRGPERSAEGRRAQVDRWGRVVLTEDGQRRTYDFDPPDRPRPGARPGDTSPALGSGAALAAAGPRAGSGGDVRLEWNRGVMGEGIGADGLHVVDLAGDGVPRVVATAVVGGGSFWYVLSARAGGYEQDWVSDVYADPIGSLRIAQMDGDPALEVVVAAGRRILVYDGATHALQSDIETAGDEIGSLTVADPDADGSREFVFCTVASFAPGPLFVVDAATGLQEFRGDAFPCSDVAAGNVDDDDAPEIVVARGRDPGWVLNGATHAIEWTNAFGFGDMVRLGDLDGDGRDEVVSGYRWDDIRVFDADLRSLAASIPVDHDLAALRVADVDGDGGLEIVYGDGQWGRLYVHDGATRALEWSVPNPEHGVTDIAVGDADDDGTPELLWGAGYTSSGPDYLYVLDTVSRVREWQSQDIGGPFLALSHGDVDADGAPELLYGSFESESGYGDGLYFVHDASTHALEYASGALTGSNWTGLWRIRNANVDADPQQEIFVTTSSTYSGILMCVDALTHLEQWRREIASGLTFSSLEMADVDLDGQLEAVAGVEVQHTGAPGLFLYVLDAATGAIEWQSPSLGPGFQNLSLVRVANVDGDPQPEIVLASYGGDVFLIDRVAGTTQSLGDHGVTALDTPDRDGDGIHEIVVGTSSGQIQVLDTAGTVTATLGVYGARIDGLAIADLDGNGSMERVFAVADELFAYAGSGELLWRSGRSGAPDSWTTWTVGAQDALRVADVDGDGFVEILVGMGSPGLRVYEVRALPTERLAIADVSLPEGDGPGFAVFTVTLSAPSTSTVTVDYATEAGSATSGVDYVSTSGTLTFPPGTMSETLQVPILGDAVFEADETFFVRLRGSAFALITGAEGVGTILNDDPPGLVIDDVTVSEPESGTAPATFTVTLSPASAVEVSVDFATEDGSATAPDDFGATSGRITFPPGTTTRTVEVSVESDAVAEATETFTVHLSGAVGASVARGVGTGTIRDRGAAGFYTLPPCRIVDTRAADAPALAAQQQRHFTLAGRCGLPSTARAAAFTVTVTGASAMGHVRLYADGTSVPNTSVVNFTAGVTRAGNAIVQLSPWQAVAAYDGQPAGTAHLILDVTGYFE